MRSVFDQRAARLVGDGEIRHRIDARDRAEVELLQPVVGEVFDLPVAAYIVALLFGMAHYESFVVDPLHQALAQQGYAFAWGLAYVWLMERSRSLLAPIVAHGVGNFTEVAIVVALGGAWS